MDDDYIYSYEPAYHPRPVGCTNGPDGVWVIRVIPANGEEPFFMTCGVDATEAYVMAMIRRLILDDDRVDTSVGRPRKYQS